jgi:molybdopterin/thiamine biosynthesis adenylyltransferase
VKKKAYDYREAFSRNIGWVSEWEQQLLAGKRVAIAGLGGVGGAHLLTLARLGIGSFHIADFDSFELANFNRQVGAGVSTLERSKVETMAAMAQDINPALSIRCLTDGVNAENLDAFLDGVDLFVDGLDFFLPEVRARVFARCAELEIPAITAAPIGMGTAYLCFMPGKMTFEEYFGFEGCSTDEKLLRFLVGLAPKAQHGAYLVDKSRLDLEARKGPSTAMACQLCTGVVGTEAVKILLERGTVRAAPAYQLFDAYRGKWVRGKLRGGHRNLLQRARLAVARRLRAKQKTPTVEVTTEVKSPIEKVLDGARWAPSGDNSQPWRFEITGDKGVLVHVHDEADTDVYDRYGDFSLVSAGCLLENMKVTASTLGYKVRWGYRRVGPHAHLLNVTLSEDETVAADPLASFIRVRSTSRNLYRTTSITPVQRKTLEACLGDDLQLRWFSSAEERFSVCRVNAMATDIRLRIREAFQVHRRVIDFEREQSPTGIAAKATGLNAMMLKVMKWSMKDFARTERLNRFLGTGAACLELDFLPGMLCGGHFYVAWRESPSRAERGRRLLHAGRSVQRFWLKATELGLAVQPGMAPVIFGSYGARDIHFTESARERGKAKRLAAALGQLLPGWVPDNIVFAGRVGVPGSRAPMPRSIRRTLSELIVKKVEPLKIAPAVTKIRRSA